MVNINSLVALYDIRPGNGAGPFLQLRSPHGAFWYVCFTGGILCRRPLITAYYGEVVLEYGRGRSFT